MREAYKALHIKLPPKVHRQLKELSVLTDKSMRDIILSLLEGFDLEQKIRDLRGGAYGE